MKNNKGMYFFLERNVFLGTSIVPKHEAKIEREAKAAQVVADYIAKKDVIRKRMKALNKRNEEDAKKLVELKAELDSIRKPVVELRLLFIPFERSRKSLIEKIFKGSKGKYMESNNEHFIRDIEDHEKKVQTIIEEINESWRKKLRPNEYSENYQFAIPIKSIKRTSRKISREKKLRKAA